MSETNEQPQKKKRGRPRKHPLPDENAPKRKRGRPKKSEQPAEPEAPETVDRSALEWAHAVLWAAENINRKTMPQVKVNGRNKTPSPMQKALWEYGREDAKSLMVTLMPKAMGIIEKHASEKVDDAVADAEQKAIDEIDTLIKAAIEESQQENQ